MPELRSLDESVEVIDLITAQHFLTILESLNLFFHRSFRPAQQELSEIGIHQLFGDSFLLGDRVVLFCGESYGRTTPLSTRLQQPYEGSPFAEITTNVYLSGQTRPVVFKGKNKPSGDPVAAPLDSVVYLLTEGEDAGIKRVDNDIIARQLMKSSFEAPDKTVATVSSMLGQVNVVGYRPNSGEDITSTYRNVLQQLKLGR